MCLLVQEYANNTPATDKFLTGVYSRNSDGIGVMWAENGVLHLRKAVLTNAKEFLAFYREHIQGKDCCWHARMRTHGDIDLTNCHPYPVFGFDGNKSAKHPMLLMHNGVLSCGNDGDRTKSDTWHYIRKFIRPILDNSPELLHNEAFQSMLASHIGSSNKFALMDHTGKAVVINRAAGVEYEGRWLSNTYAWDYYGLHPNAKRAYTSGYSGFNSYSRDTDAYYGSGKRWGAGGTKDALGNDKPKEKTPATVTPITPAIAAKDTELDDIVSFAERVMDISTNAYDALNSAQINRLFKEFGVKDVETWLEGFEYGQLTEADFIAGMKDPRKVKNWLSHPGAGIWNVGS